MGLVVKEYSNFTGNILVKCVFSISIFCEKLCRLTVTVTDTHDQEEVNPPTPPTHSPSQFEPSHIPYWIAYELPIAYRLKKADRKRDI